MELDMTFDDDDDKKQECPDIAYNDKIRHRIICILAKIVVCPFRQGSVRVDVLPDNNIDTGSSKLEEEKDDEADEL